MVETESMRAAPFFSTRFNMNVYLALAYMIYLAKAINTSTDSPWRSESLFYYKKRLQKKRQMKNKSRQWMSHTMEASACNPAERKWSPTSWARWQSFGMSPSKLNMYVLSIYFDNIPLVSVWASKYNWFHWSQLKQIMLVIYIICMSLYYILGT